MLIAKRITDGKLFKVRKYIDDNKGSISVWCEDWYGHHIVDKDCELIWKV